MRAYYYDFQIDGKPILMPDQDVAIEYSDIDSEETGRDEAGFMHRIVLRSGVRKWPNIPYSHLTREEYIYMESLFKDKPTFTVTYMDHDGTEAECVAYRSNHGITIRNAVTGAYRNYKFSIIEC